MTENRRIVLNVIATYGRSLYALVCGLFTGRWVLMALGETDFGLYGLISGITGLMTFAVGLLGAAVGRFYAFSVGESKVAETAQEGLENSCRWFNVAVSIHLLIPLVLTLIGGPFIEYIIRNAWLNIPADRVDASIWVFRYTCLSTFIAFVTVPYTAMYTAKQYIAELTIYSFITTTLSVIVIYYMASHPGVWLSKYALWIALTTILPNFIISIRAHFIFPECRIRFAYLWDWPRSKKLVLFTGWTVFGTLGGMVRGQGLAIVLNKYFGATVNAAMAIGNSLSNHCSSLSGSMIGAFSPAITNARGVKDFERMRKLAFQSSKFGTLFLIIFALPLMLEIHEVLRIWLVTPPKHVAGLCICVLIAAILDKATVGQMMAVSANGVIAKYQVVNGIILLLTLPLAWFFVEMGLGVYSVGWALLLMTMILSVSRARFANSLVGMSARYWFLRVILPLLFSILLSGMAGYSIRYFCQSSFFRVCITTLTTELVLLPLSWFFILASEERQFIRKRMKQCFVRKENVA